MLALARTKYNKDKPVSPHAVGIMLTDVITGELLNFHSLGSTIRFLKDKGHKAD